MSMHVHLPKALHNWRELAREIAIIVVGVLIALFFEQLVEGWRWQHKIAAAENAMRFELLWDDGPQLYQRWAMHPCVVARLDGIRSAVEAGRPRGEVRALIDSFWLPSFSYDSIAHQEAIASDVASHMSHDESDPYDALYDDMPRLDRTSEQEGAAIAQLRVLKRTGGALSPEEQDKVLSAVEVLRNDDRIIWLPWRWALPYLRKVGQLDAQRIRDFMTAARKHYGACVKDLPAALPRNGSSYLG
jgi:hypothetical protein